MKAFTLWFASLFIKNHTHTSDPDVRAHYGAFEGWVSIIGNTLLFAIKLVIGLAVNSAALIADAIHTLTDSATSAVVIVGFKMSRKPSDSKHPFGHGRIEPVATLIIAILLFVAGFELLKQSVASIMSPTVGVASYGTIAIVFATALAKEIMARFSFILGDHIDSDTLKADALHHRTDAFSTLLVIVALIASHFGYLQMDGIMGIGVSLAIFASAWAIAREAVNPLIGEAPPKNLLDDIEGACRAVSHVLGVHDIVVHNYGENRIVSLHIEVPHHLSATAVHEIAEDVEESVGRITGGMVVVHMDPINREHPHYQEVLENVRTVIAEDDRILTFHDLRIVGETLDRGTILFHITLTDDNSTTDHQTVLSDTRKKIAARFPHLDLLIKIAPMYSYNP
ncbi:cation diffusion facilitator transporter [Desulfoluna limicola]|uniref:Cation diffusion facilitator transporter n=1 Tax=Desulfoluna limicola TaxID=2810562 RepID=A0ABM7PB81_9BACT|nr:cation diffusion facilitator family transporter [Desulfoluna limicola]BCS94400.1 cation diffusion facilitator transporter [Desulfoluna limicola]